MKAKNLTLLFLVSSVSYLYTSENTSQKLSFTLNHKLCFTSYNSNNMTYYKNPQDFFNKNIFAVLPFDAEDKKNIVQAFQKAADANQMTSTSYTLDGNRFVTHILPLKALSKGKEVSYFFIEVMPDDIR